MSSTKEYTSIFADSTESTHDDGPAPAELKCTNCGRSGHEVSTCTRCFACDMEYDGKYSRCWSCEQGGAFEKGRRYCSDCVSKTKCKLNGDRQIMCATHLELANAISADMSGQFGHKFGAW
eukprot:m.213508 g.213508  ORF g.213508 m.213508 type:complete len:121 (+) comp25564_c1_seq1:106-468(+)